MGATEGTAKASLPGQSLTGHSGIVTGAARGIGLAIARTLRSAGARLALCDADADALAAAARGMASGPHLLARTCDVRSTSQVEAFVDAAQSELGAVNFLVNNAGVLSTQRLVETTDEEWERVLDVNLTGSFRMTRSVLPGMLEQGYGRIVSLASITPLRGEAHTGAYAASKGGIIGLTKSLSREVAHRGVTVNAVAPGYILTDQTKQVFGGKHGESIRSQITTRDFGRPDDIAGAIAYLVSDTARYVTGHVLVVDGGVL